MASSGGAESVVADLAVAAKEQEGSEGGASAKHGHVSFHLGGAWKQGPAKQPEAEQPKALDNLAAAKQREAGQDIAAAKQPGASQDIAAKQPEPGQDLVAAKKQDAGQNFATAKQPEAEQNIAVENQREPGKNLAAEAAGQELAAAKQPEAGEDIATAKQPSGVGKNLGAAKQTEAEENLTAEEDLATTKQSDAANSVVAVEQLTSKNYLALAYPASIQILEWIFMVSWYLLLVLAHCCLFLRDISFSAWRLSKNVAVILQDKFLKQPEARQDLAAVKQLEAEQNLSVAKQPEDGHKLATLKQPEPPQDLATVDILASAEEPENLSQEEAGLDLAEAGQDIASVKQPEAADGQSLAVDSTGAGQNLNQPGEQAMTTDHKADPNEEERKPADSTNNTAQGVKVVELKEVDLKRELSRIMFVKHSTWPKKIPLSVIEDQAKFAGILQAFHDYENATGSDRLKSDGAAMTKLKKHIDSKFKDDFLLYLLLVHIMHSKPKFYDCEQVIGSVLYSFQHDLIIKDFTEVVEKFIRRGDFPVHASRSVFCLLVEACLSLVDRPYVTRFWKKKPKAVYSRMLLASVAMKFHENCPVEDATDTTVKKNWNELFIKLQGHPFDADLTKELKDGIQVGCHLRLTRSYRNLSCLLATNTAVRPFTELRYFVREIAVPLDVKNFRCVLTEVQPLYYHYVYTHSRTKINLKSLCSSGTLEDCLEEGLKFLAALISILPDGDHLDSVQKWSQVMIFFVDFTEPNYIALIKLFNFEKGSPLKRFSKVFESMLIQAITKELPKLSGETFFELMNNFRFIPKEIVIEFLGKCTITSDIKLKDPPWTKLLPMCTNPATDTEALQLVAFICNVGLKYKEENQPLDFILTLLQHEFLLVDLNALEMKPLFVKYFYDYISNHCKLMKNIKHVIEITSLIKHENGLQLLILTCLSENILPEEWTKDTNTYFSGVINCVNSALTANTNWLVEFTMKHRFCWGVLTTCCSKVATSEKDLKWAQHYAPIIKPLSEVFIYTCRESQISPTDYSDSDLLLRVQSCDMLLQKYFECIANIQQALLHWKKKIDECKHTYDEIMMYKFSHEALMSVKMHPSFLLESQTVLDAEIDFLIQFDKLNSLLLWYVGEKWCAFPSFIEEYEVRLPKKLISDRIIFPDEDGQHSMKNLGSLIPPYADGGFKPDSYITLSLHRDVTLKELTVRVAEIQRFQQPLLKFYEVLVFFKNEGTLFGKYLQEYLHSQASQEFPVVSSAIPAFAPALQPSKDEASEGISMETFVSGIEHAHERIHHVMSGTLTYLEMPAGIDQLNDMDIEREVAILHRYAELSKSEFSDPSGVQSMLELPQYITQCEHIKEVCKQYVLTACLQDPNFQEMLKIIEENSSTEARSNLTLNRAKELVGRLKGILCLTEKPSSKYLKIFKTMRDSAFFYHFTDEKNFYGKQGLIMFRQQYDLITAQLQHEQYDEQVLNQLEPAFEAIGPFMYKDRDFTQLMTAVTDVANPEDNLKHLETVNSNMTTIQKWFSRAEDDTLKNVGETLQCILSTGFYCLCKEEDAYGVGSGQMFLHYNKPTSQVPGEDQLEKWNGEQIRDFVRKLGFVDKNKAENGVKIKCFLSLHQTVSNLLRLYMKLNDLGHPQFLAESRLRPIYCSDGKQKVREEVFDTQEVVVEWQKNISMLRSRYTWLLYFSIPKMLLLYRHIKSPPPGIDVIVHEVSFVVYNQEVERIDLQRGVENALQNMVATERPDPAISAQPMKVVGQFLEDLFSLPLVENKLSLPHQTYRVSYHSAQPLYFCPECSQMDIVCLILTVFSGIPESYQILHCHETTTEEELDLFLMRVKIHCSHYLILNFNKLPFKLQEIMVTQVKDLNDHKDISTIHFVETASSMLQEMPWIQQKDIKDPSLAPTAAQNVHLQKLQAFSCLEIVHGKAGNGKTHYIKKELTKCTEHVTIAINEAFSPSNAIIKLRSISTSKENVGIFFNFTIPPPGDDVEKYQYHELMKVVGWFFFDLLLLGYIEDSHTGLSFCIPKRRNWSIYVEVPYHSDMEKKNLADFFDEVPVLKLIGTIKIINDSIPYDVDNDVQLVCKYLQAYECGKINRLYDEKTVVKFSTDSDLKDEDCYRLLQKYMRDYVSSSKITQQLFIRYMKRRCHFLDNCPGFNFNNGIGEMVAGRKTNTKELGSILMRTMLSEVHNFCDPLVKFDWSRKAHQQLIYDFKDGGGTFGLISLKPKTISPEDKRDFTQLGVKIPSEVDLYSRAVLDDYLSRALNIDLKDGRLSLIDDKAYVLTLDYAIKMLNIHERYKCGVPVVIEGETGVGKTFLVEMLSMLWNHSHLLKWNLQRSNLLESFKTPVVDPVCQSRYGKFSPLRSAQQHAADKSRSGKFSPLRSAQQHAADKSRYQKFSPPWRTQQHATYVAAVESLSSDTPFDAVLKLCGQFHHQIHHQLRKGLQIMGENPIIPLLTHKNQTMSIEDIFERAKEEDCSPEATAHLLYAILSAEVDSTFHKINIHAAMTPEDVKKYFELVFRQAEHCLQYAIGKPYDPLTVTVFLDEVNTSSCLGLFKEIIIDKTFDGKSIPENLFLVAACNPHRGNSLISHNDAWVTGAYYVRSLHPTLKLLMWDYGSLDKNQERDYINEKMAMANRNTSELEISSLTNLLVISQEKMREFASHHLMKQNVTEASLASRSCVSQRDIQRVFTFYGWFMRMYRKFNPHKEEGSKYHRRAIMVSLFLVYYMRLSSEFRKKYSQYLNKTKLLPGEIKFTEAFEQEIDYYIKQVELPKGIAHTVALKENLFATIICTITHTPLIIVGAPGSSKTLSFNQTVANLKGEESKKAVFREADFFRSLQPFYYQCSRHTTSNEIESIFSLAVNRQQYYEKNHKSIYCVVFMDEAGLPEERHESLKVLHYHLDRQVVSFVAITNHVLDAAKTNRAVSLFRPEASDKDLRTLAMGCMCMEEETALVKNLCSSYSNLMKKKEKGFCSFFGLRDFIQFLSYIKKNLEKKIIPHSQVVMQALERNFNGYDEFDKICKTFLYAIDKTIKCQENLPRQRHILDVLQESMKDCPSSSLDLVENQARYKLIIDPSEDESVVRLLFSFGILVRKNTRVFVCSDFPGDGQLQKINTIAAIRHSAMEGHTVVMSQTDDIHESFYDLFNQRFRRIDDPKNGPRYYANIAIGAHSKPSLVHPNFQCVVIVKKSEIKHTPAPFLNRFEKYLISHSSLLDATLQQLPPCMAILIQVAKEKVENLIEIAGNKSFYGMRNETLDSLILSILPSLDLKYAAVEEKSDCLKINSAGSVTFFLFQAVLNLFRDHAGFYIPRYDDEEMKLDCDYLFEMAKRDPYFSTIMMKLSHQDTRQAVIDAFNFLCTANEPGTQDYHLNTASYMVIFLLQHLLVRRLTKKMMNLMTTEGLILNCNKIPYTYLRNYLDTQTHFSLKEAITRHHCTLRATISDISRSSNKLICYTRSSSLIHTLPATYPHSSTMNRHKLVRSLIFEEANLLQISRLSSLQSQTSVQEMLAEFVNSDTAEVLVLIANMQETAPKTINHVRVMIEEAELQTSGQHCKLFVLLLYFSPVQFFQHCYPALFLRGWDHCYLDTIAHHVDDNVVNIYDWLTNCCFQDLNKPATPHCGEALTNYLYQIVVPMLSARVRFGNKKGNSFNSAMNVADRSKAIIVLLREKGLGDILCEKFLDYWKPNTLVKFLKRAATVSKERESTLNITDSVQTQFKALFACFCIYMLAHANEDYNLDIVYAESPSTTLHALFVSIFKILPVPKLEELSARSNYLTQAKPSVLPPNFPFFHFVYNSLEELVDISIKTVNLQSNFLVDNSGANFQQALDSSATLLEFLTDAVFADLERQLEPPLNVVGLAFDAMAKDQDLWQLYFADFMTYKLKLVDPSQDPSSNIAQKLLRAFFSQLHNKDMPKRAVELHCHANISHHFFAQLASILRSLNRMEEFTHHAEQLLDVVKRSQHPLGSPAHLANFVTKTMFSSLLTAVPLNGNSASRTSDAFVIWFKSYRDIMSLPTLKTYVYTSMAPGEGSTDAVGMERMMNIMQTTFILLQSSPSLGEDKGHKIIQALFSLFVTDRSRAKCSENFQLKSRPSLGRVVEIALEAIVSVECGTKLQECNIQAKLVLEGLLSHFFSADRASYAMEDVGWFLELVNKQEFSKEGISEAVKLVQHEGPREAFLRHCIETSLSKYYLGCILANHVGNSTNQPASDPLSLYNQQLRALIGKVLIQSTNLGSIGPYIPRFYRDGVINALKIFPKNPCMEQPLCHVYFLTVMEHLWNRSVDDVESNKVNAHTRVAVSVMKQMENTSREELILLRIEFQAIVQVLCFHLADCLDPQQTQKLGNFQRFIESLNNVLSNMDVPAKCNGLVLSVHLMKRLKSSHKFIDLFTITTSNISNIKCLKPIYSALKTPLEMRAHLFPFLRLGFEDILYSQLAQLTSAIHEGHKELTEFYHLARDNMKREEKDSRHYKFRMMLWLVAYYEFYERKIDSQLLSTAMGSEEMSTCLHDDKGYIRLVQCFLSPNLFVQRKERVPQTYQQQNINQRDKFDHLYNLFDPTKQDELDQSERDLRYSLANLVAVIVGSPSGSNHLWYHLFALDKLGATFMTGFLFPGRAGLGYHYDCGVEFTFDGAYGRPNYRARANQGTFTLHSLYLLLWANFGCFCMALLTQPNSHNQLLGPIISSWQPVRNYCIWELRTLWMFMQDNLGLTEEERCFYVMNAMTTFREVFSQSTSSLFGGVFKTSEALSAYEKMWHRRVYQPTWNNLKTGFAQFSKEHKNGVLNEIKQLSVHYPHFPSVLECMRSITNGHVEEDDQETIERSLLSKFAMDWERLQVGGELLPSLVELYTWLHKNLAHILTFERASTISIGRVISLIEEKKGREFGEHMRNLYERVKDRFNRYVNLIGGVIGAGACAAMHRENEITKISDDVPILHFLSDSEAEEQGNDCLYTVIGDIIANHNLVVENRVHRLLPECSSLVFPLEVTANHAVIGSFSEICGISSFLQLLRSRYIPESREFQADKLEEDLVSTFVVGKPIIGNPSLLRTVFKFKKDQQQLVLEDAVCSLIDLERIAEELPESFKDPFSAERMKKFKYAFHSASYHLMNSVMTVMRNILGHVVNVISKGEPETERLLEKTVKDFIPDLCNNPNKQEIELFHEIGFQFPDPNPDHIRCLSELPLTAIYSCLKLFIHWVDEGFYDFNTLTFPFKTSLGLGDKEILDELPEKWNGTPDDLLQWLEKFIGVLKHNEEYIITLQAHETKSILEYLKEMMMLDDDDPITQYIPGSIKLCHYVELRLALRRIKRTVRNTQQQHQVVVEKWSDCVDDLWAKHFPHLSEMVRVEQNSAYVQQGELDADVTDELAVSLNKEPEEKVEDSNVLKRSEQVEEGQLKGTENSGNSGTTLPDLPSLARDFTVDDVTTFLEKIELSQHVEKFKEAEVSGDLLLELDSEMFEELKVKSHLHRMKIAYLFRKKLKGRTTKYSNEHLSQFLRKCKLDKHITALTENGIDGDMILEADSDLMKNVLKEIGIGSPLDRSKIMLKYKTFVSKS